MEFGILGPDGTVGNMRPSSAKQRIVIASDGRVHMHCDVQIGGVYG